MTSTYRPLLPLDAYARVIDQFGFLPVSVFRPEKRPDWDDAIGDEGDTTGQTRRSGATKYLPGLRYSRFHPHLAEVCIRYWSLEGDRIVDPFAGRATRGVIATLLGRHYEGYEISPASQERGHQQIASIDSSSLVRLGDGCAMAETTAESADLVFTCPPYHRLERYESVPNQLSDILSYEAFLTRMAEAAANIMRVLKPGRWAVIVVADWRDGRAFRLFHVDLINIMRERVGVDVHDIMVIHNNSPFAPLQAGKVAAKRYTSKVHEYALVFRKPE